eukprot:1129397-Alexandrium_andersonii.AAC.1
MHALRRTPELFGKFACLAASPTQSKRRCRNYPQVSLQPGSPALPQKQGKGCLLQPAAHHCGARRSTA